VVEGKDGSVGTLRLSLYNALGEMYLSVLEKGFTLYLYLRLSLEYVSM
jgi:hypothetical protein